MIAQRDFAGLQPGGIFLPYKLVVMPFVPAMWRGKTDAADGMVLWVDAKQRDITLQIGQPHQMHRVAQAETVGHTFGLEARFLGLADDVKAKVVAPKRASASACGVTPRSVQVVWPS